MSEVIKKVWLDADGALYLSNPAIEQGQLDNGVYRLEQDMFERLYLRKVYDEFAFDYKVYGLESEFVDRVVKTYENTKGNLGVLLNGVRGTGKTVSSKIIANRLNQPVVIIDVPFDKTVDFISSIPQDITIFLDEYEKTFKDSAVMLTIMDGVLNNDKRRVFLLTTNDLYVDRNLLQRPSRIRYMKSFEDLSPAVVEEIIDDYLIHKEFKQDLLKFVSCLELITVDVVKAIIQETNIHKESPYDFADLFNVKKNSGKYDIHMLDDKGKKTTFIKNMNVYPRPKFQKDIDGAYVELGGKYIGEVLEVISPNIIKVKPNVKGGKPIGFVAPIVLEFEVSETRHYNYAFAYGYEDDIFTKETIGETVIKLIDRADNLSTESKEFKNTDFTIEGYANNVTAGNHFVEATTKSKPAFKKQVDVSSKLADAFEDYVKSSVDQG